MKRDRYIKYCKKRALEYVDNGKPVLGFLSILSDVRKCPETIYHPEIDTGIRMMLAGKLSTVEEMREFIEGFK